MSVLKAICIAVSTYSILPVPRFDWTAENLRHSLCALPLVGLPIGALLLLWNWLCGLLGIGPVLFAAVAAALPVFVTGGIHLDGFCDTVDALASHQTRERKLEILKDPHVGAFAVIYVCLYLLLCFGLYSRLLSSAALPVVCVGFAFSRSLTVFSTITLPNARSSGMLAAFTNHVNRRVEIGIAACCPLACCAGMLACSISAGACCILLCGLWFFLYRRICIAQFGGATGDTTGFFLQMTELFALIGAVCGTFAEWMV